MGLGSGSVCAPVSPLSVTGPWAGLFTPLALLAMPVEWAQPVVQRRRYGGRARQVPGAHAPGGHPTVSKAPPRAALWVPVTPLQAPPPPVLGAGSLSQAWAPRSGSSRQKRHRRRAGYRGAIMKNCHLESPRPGLSSGLGSTGGADLPSALRKPGLCSQARAHPLHLGQPRPP